MSELDLALNDTKGIVLKHIAKQEAKIAELEKIRDAAQVVVDDGTQIARLVGCDVDSIDALAKALEGDK